MDCGVLGRRWLCIVGGLGRGWLWAVGGCESWVAVDRGCLWIVSDGGS